MGPCVRETFPELSSRCLDVQMMGQGGTREETLGSPYWTLTNYYKYYVSYKRKYAKFNYDQLRWGGRICPTASDWVWNHQGYDARQNTWEPYYNLNHTKDAIAKFYRLNPGAPRRISSIAFHSIGFASTSGHHALEGGVMSGYLPHFPFPFTLFLSLPLLAVIVVELSIFSLIAYIRRGKA